MGRAAIFLAAAAPALCFHATQRPIPARGLWARAQAAGPGGPQASLRLPACKQPAAAAASRRGIEPIPPGRESRGSRAACSSTELSCGARSAHRVAEAVWRGILHWASRTLLCILAAVGIGLGAWGPPAAAVAAEASTATIGVIRAFSGGWQQDRDPRTGRVFYINHQVREHAPSLETAWASKRATLISSFPTTLPANEMCVHDATVV